MTEHQDLDEIAAALAAFQAEMPKVAKGKTAKVPTKAGGSYSYNYADLADVVEAATPLLAKNGLSFVCLPRTREDGRYELVGTLLHKSGQHLQGALPLAGVQPQEIGSSLTYMRRYLLGCLTGIVTDEDDDGQIANDAAIRQHEQQQAKQAADADARTRMYRLMDEIGLPDPASKLAFAADVVGRQLHGAADLNPTEVEKVSEALAAELDIRQSQAEQAIANEGRSESV